MTAILHLALRSLANRRATVLLTLLAIATSVALLLGVEKVRSEARASFASTISGTDLIVGARSGSTQLLLYSVFRIGNATANISWRSYERIAADPDVAWTIPLSLGDSHRGFRVVGTSTALFEHYRFSRDRRLSFAAGRPFAETHDAVIGAQVARRLGYSVGDRIVIAHGLGDEGFQEHGDDPFTVVGILEATGTPVDRAIHVPLEGIEAMHLGYRSGATGRAAFDRSLVPTEVTAVLVGLKSRLATFSLQRRINEDRRDPMLAILPGVALQELWDMMGTAEAALGAISAMVVVTGLLGMMVMLLSSLSERRREMAILRSVGAQPRHVFALLTAEAGLLTVLGAALGLALVQAGLWLASGWVARTYGLYLTPSWPSAREWAYLGLVILGGLMAGAIPAWRATRQSLADGMIVRG